MPGKEFHVYDDDGYIGIVNADSYISFVDSDWQLNQLFNHFSKAINDETLIVWGTSPGGGSWIVDFLEARSEQQSFREFESTIVVTDGRLYLVNYTDLTMAAQFEDYTLPDKRNTDLCIELQPGRYRCIVRQMFIPEKDGDRFEIILRPAERKGEPVNDVYWNTRF
ncbi:hypothetical protein [Chitinophaga sp.]|uniref:hypothetical protein n=1 Tax=Chitinophaga sp. TaxID=1869181 RepID=UPI002F9458D3